MTGACQFCGHETPDEGMRCKDRAMCAQRADYAYIREAIKPTGKRHYPSHGEPYDAKQDWPRAVQGRADLTAAGTHAQLAQVATGPHIVCKCGCVRFSPWTVIRTKGKSVTLHTEWRCDECGRPTESAP